MIEIKLSVNKMEELDEVMSVAETVFKPNAEEKSKYHRRDDWVAKINNGLMVTASINSEIVGFAICYRKEKNLHIWNVGVLPKYRKNGVWQKMYEVVLSFAMENNFSGLSLNTYQDKFPGMYNFCATHGFEEYKTEIDELQKCTKSMFLKKLV